MTPTSVSKLQVLAIAAAKAGNWEEAVTLNTDILNQEPQDVNALNRLGLAYLQTGDMKAAKQRFQEALAVDKNNPIARKQLEKIKSNISPASPSFNKTYFIEEPGKTKIVELHRLSGKQVLDQLAVGQSCALKLKNRYISVETEDGKYIGALPEDISFRLTKLIQTGNTYYCSVHSCSNNQATVYLKEISRSKQNTDIHSFPPNKANANPAELDERFLIEDFDEEGALIDGEEDGVEELDSSHERETRSAPVEFDD